MKKYIVLMFATVLMITLTGCGKSLEERAAEKALEATTGGRVDVDYDADGTVSYTADGVTVSTSDRLPKGWPSDAPIYPGSKIDVTGASTQVDNAGLAVVLTTPDSGEKVFDYYREEIEKQGWEIDNLSNFGDISAVSALKNGKNFTALITSQNGETQIVLSISDKE